MSPDPRVLDADEPRAYERAAALLREGGVLAVPTDTVYGIACDPSLGDAAERIRVLKGRPVGMELSILGDSREQLVVHGVLEGTAAALGRAFWPGALSVVVRVANRHRFAVPRGDTVSLRIPDCTVLRRLLRITGPLASTSANRHTEPAATTWEECIPLLDGGVDAILAGPPAGGRGSTIIDCTEASPRVLRAGPLSLEVLRPYLGE